MMSIAPFILLQQQMEESVRNAEEKEEKKRKEEENQKREEDDYAGMTSCTRTTYEKIPFGVCMVYPSHLYCKIY